MMLAATAAAAIPTRLAGQTPTTLRVLGSPNDGFKTVIYAVESGLFRRYGLTIEPTLVSNGAAAAAAAIGGNADIAFTNLLTLLQAHSRGVPLQFISPASLVFAGHWSTQTLVLNDSPIRSGRDMNGKTLGCGSVRDIAVAATWNWIDKTGGDYKTVRVIEMPQSAGAAFLEEKRADAVTLNEPGVTQALAGGKLRILANPFESVAPATIGAGYAALTASIERNREAMTKFAQAMHESSRYTNTHPAETVELVARYSGATPDQVARSVRVFDAEYLDPAYMQPLIDVCVRYGMLDRAILAQEVISAVALRPPRRR
jgi:NitT/TauT family transport system substrate-binding protein